MSEEIHVCINAKNIPCTILHKGRVFECEEDCRALQNVTLSDVSYAQSKEDNRIFDFLFVEDVAVYQPLDANKARLIMGACKTVEDFLGCGENVKWTASKNKGVLKAVPKLPTVLYDSDTRSTLREIEHAALPPSMFFTKEIPKVQKRKLKLTASKYDKTAKSMMNMLHRIAEDQNTSDLSDWTERVFKACANISMSDKNIKIMRLGMYASFFLGNSV